MISPENVGFGTFRGVLTHAEVDSLVAALAVSTRSRAGARHLMANEDVACLSKGERLADLASTALGSRAVPYRATLFDKSPGANWLVVWHQDTALPLEQRFDTPGWGPWSTKAGVLYAHAPAAALQRIVALRVHLDDSTSDNGPLRVFPASHRLGVLSDIAIQDLVRRECPHECTVPRGGVLLMRPPLVHASSKSVAAVPRRVLHLEYAATLRFEQRLTLRVA